MDTRRGWAPRLGPIGLTAVAGLAVIAVVALTDPLRRDGLMPHGHCYLWRPALVWLHVVSDALIGASYVAISATLAYIVYRARRDVPFGWMLLAFGLFIITCGMTHFMEVWTLWTPVYWLSADVKVVTAGASVVTALALPPLVPRALALIEASKGVDQHGRMLEKANRELSAQIAERERTEAELCGVRSDLERRVDERTAELRRLAADNGRLYDAERTARSDAEAANRMKDDFLAILSHELRTPLTPILAWTRMLARGNLDAVTTAAALASIERNARSQAQLVEDLLDVSRIVAGSFRIDVHPIELQPVVESALDAIGPVAAAKSVRLEPTLEPGNRVLGDSERLQQVARNLIANAVKFTPHGGVVRVDLGRVDGHVELTVSDTGVGIDSEFVPHVFDRFRQGDPSTTRTHGGLGIGLAIVSNLVEQHGGSVSVRSAGEGQGAAFTVRLPLVTDEIADVAAHLEPPAPPTTPAPAPPAPASAGPSSPSLDGLSVLIVDDDADTVDVVRNILDGYGATTRSASSAAEALAILREWRPNLVISDIGMPHTDGYGLIRALRQAQDEAVRGLPVIALTGYARVEDRNRALSAGFQMHVPKPVDPTVLVTVVTAVVDARSLLQA